MSYFILYGVLALWVLFDSLIRRIGPSAVLWVIGTAVLGPIILPVYLASRPLKQGEIREGGKAWNVLKNFAILWTIVMAIASIAALTNMAKFATGLTSDAEQAGAGVGMLVGMGLLGAVWFFPTMGAALLGFLLKKNTIIETGPTGPLVGQSSGANAAGGWAGLIGFAVLGLIALAVSSSKQSHRPASEADEASTSSEALFKPTDNGWRLIESKDEMDNTPRITLGKHGSGGSRLIIRCVKRKTEAYVDTDSILDNGIIRIKFDQSPPSRQRWEKSTDDKALFVPDPITFARKLTTAKTFMLEFTPFQEGTRTVSFDITNLNEKLKKVSDACDWAAVDKARERAKAANAALRERLIKYVHPCENQEIGKWCWSDPNDDVHNTDNSWSDTKEEALEDAMEYARLGLAFKKQ